MYFKQGLLPVAVTTPAVLTLAAAACVAGALWAVSRGPADS
jgi:hypothetical protein